jgi:NADPH-dependent ferric siderophore reductase
MTRERTIRIEKIAMSLSPPPYALHSVTIDRVKLVTPHMKRITIDGRGLSSLRPGLPAQWFKVFAPTHSGQRSSGRAYTVRRFDPETGALDIDFALHGDNGPISAWAERARVGDRFEISDVHPRSGFCIKADQTHYVLLGDETGLPAIGAILEALPPHAQAHVFVEVIDKHEEQSLTSPAALTLTWLHRAAYGTKSPMSLEVAARAMDMPAGAAIWITAESTKVATLRRLLLKDRGIDRDRLHATGYWKRGEVDHRDEQAE